ncbi:MAG TPA: hypothetical protein VHD86_18045 [Xanthobacteraceae bacterium]|jgi:hypothetical protein|nr:hypothetical protein [Xanthobacteraceae bacterium]
MPTEASGEPDQPEAQSPRAAALYIGKMSAELARLARRYRLEPLAYILEMARLEAEQIARESVDGAEVAQSVRANCK